MEVTFRLQPRPPFRLDLTAWALRRRPANAVDRWDGQTYRRVLPLGGRPVEMAVTGRGASLRVTLSGRVGPGGKAQAKRALERLLGLRVDLTPFYRFAGRDSRLAALVERFRGVKPPRFLTVFEGLANAITCQQLSLTVGIILLNRLAERCGLAWDGQHAFPRPEELATTDVRTLRALGYSHSKGRSLIGLARSIVDGQLDLDALDNLSDDDALSRLLDLHGVGRWTAEYVLLRGLRRVNLFPGDDVGARNNLARWLHLRRELDYDRVEHVLRKYQPYGGLVYFHLLLDSLSRAGYLS